MARDLALHFDPALLASAADIILDDWQADFVRADDPQIAMLIPRQHGKTEAAVMKALPVALTEPHSLILIVSPAQRLSDEFVRRARVAYGRVKDAPSLVGDAARRMEFDNGSRILALPGDNEGDTLRGLANVRLCIIDETSRCSDALITAVRPMLATSKRGQLVYLSTPNGKRGVFYETWTSDDADWHRIRVGLGDCDRITPEFLARERKNLGETKYREEYLCEFIDSDTAAFNTSIIDAAFSTEVRALWR
ncbi:MULTISPECIES: terminase family protein [Rhodopseudomonas]|nr:MULTISPECIES: terminase family protein [Rhodopseudomonas]MDF3810549.1 terminase family protein [Rhodopseudomonas sp. BAL398]WOK18393.1 terminase family protein [Rhodopseudomonas sp. BAL398]